MIKVIIYDFTKMKKELFKINIYTKSKFKIKFIYEYLLNLFTTQI